MLVLVPIPPSVPDLQVNPKPATQITPAPQRQLLGCQRTLNVHAISQSSILRFGPHEYSQIPSPAGVGCSGLSPGKGFLPSINLPAVNTADSGAQMNTSSHLASHPPRWPCSALGTQTTPTLWFTHTRPPRPGPYQRPPMLLLLLLMPLLPLHTKMLRRAHRRRLRRRRRRRPAIDPLRMHTSIRRTGALRVVRRPGIVR
jgi:hypothetical protein